MRFGLRGSAWRIVATAVAALALGAHAAEPALPDPLKLSDALTIAREHRAEIAAAKARAYAASRRPAVVSGLEDPEIAPSLDHLPFMLDGANFSVSIQQRFPLSGVLGFKGRAAEAEAARVAAEARRVGLDVELDAAAAFFMVHEKRGMGRVLDEQRALAKQVVDSATARYASGNGSQAEVLRAEMELARLGAASRANAAEVRGAEAMLEVSLGRAPSGGVPALDVAIATGAPTGTGEAMKRSLEARPELAAGRAEIDRADAETRTMRAMAAPMMMVRTGPAYTMTEGAGWMLMVGVSVPLWFGKYKAGIDEADAMAEMARADLTAMQRMVAGDAAQARERVMAARERYLSLRDDVLPRATRAVQPTLAAYASGQVPLVSVVEAVNALWMAQGELVMAEAELGLAWARLDRALGVQRGTP